MKERSDAQSAPLRTVEEVKALARDELLQSLRQATRVHPVQAFGLSGTHEEAAEGAPAYDAAADGVPARHWLHTLPGVSVGLVNGRVDDLNSPVDVGLVSQRPGVDLWGLLEGRKSALDSRRVGAEVCLEVMRALGTVREERSDDVGRLWQSRVYPSAGGTHCIEPLLYVAPSDVAPPDVAPADVAAEGFGADVGGPGGGPNVESSGVSGVAGLHAGWYRYQHATGDLERVAFLDGARVLTALMGALHGSPHPPVVVFAVADPDLLGARYPGGSSLLWRDAGVFLMASHLISNACGAVSTIVGVCVELASAKSTATPPFVVGGVALGAAVSVGENQDARRSEEDVRGG